MNGHANGDDASKMTLYTNHSCPYAHRAHIALHELGLSYDEVIIDLEKPREPWYLDVNPVSDLSSQFSCLCVSHQFLHAKDAGDASSDHSLPHSNHLIEGKASRSPTTHVISFSRCSW